MSRALLALGLLALACGYRLVDPQAALGPDAHRIEVRIFENRSLEPGAERLLADALVEEFARRGALEPVYSGEGPADLVLSGSVQEVTVRGAAFSSVGLAVESTVGLTLDVAVLRQPQGELVWRHRSLRLQESFLNSPDPQAYELNKEHALRRLAADAASLIHDELFQQF